MPINFTSAARDELAIILAHKHWQSPSPIYDELLQNIFTQCAANPKMPIGRRRLRKIIAPIICYAYAWPGGYPVVYQQGNDLHCPECQQREYRLHGHYGRPYIHEEGPPIECDECGKEIESAYGDPDAEEDNLYPTHEPGPATRPYAPIEPHDPDANPF